ncbi:conserved hypothetical protein [Beutenbergia cavernae DSM 12333]|uniref:Uncharacterized protein n=1 Tax=Beutenbergia cavernae (strain ATCC BAA-8 / DSM 12333 / CCUG 43141 / JCM 11478 / NBRC 16432 / NCIMB 13614 / HKI 0122) TaxID=471853 RepID=C5C1W9_BEUC1|nr:hypothetical protein [Beutenbergia cavernae]ACQ79587.1 conserved hypothetical protein [Beutenbergia cavernae DSM 12333]
MSHSPGPAGAAASGADPSDWASGRREAAAEHERRLRARQAAESDRAGAMLAQFVDDARAAGLAPQRLEVRGYGGRGRASSDVEGWYLRADRTAGVGTDGAFYVLTAPLSLVDRVRGVRLRPSAPPLVLGAGGKDGESIDLRDALARLLA